MLLSVQVNNRERTTRLTKKDAVKSVLIHVLRQFVDHESDDLRAKSLESLELLRIDAFVESSPLIKQDQISSLTLLLEVASVFGVYMGYPKE